VIEVDEEEVLLSLNTVRNGSVLVILIRGEHLVVM
jgi:hypothetical protein